MVSRPRLHRPCRKFPTRHHEWVRTAHQPRSTGFRAGTSSRGVTTPVSLVYLPVSLTAPGPSGSPETDATSSRLLPPSPATPGSGCLQLHFAATTTKKWTVSHLHPATTAPRGAPDGTPHERQRARSTPEAVTGPSDVEKY